MGVLMMMVATTKVTARVNSAKSSPRTALTRNTTAPSRTPSTAGSSAAKGKVARNGQSSLPARAAVVYMPTP